MIPVILKWRTRLPKYRKLTFRHCQSVRTEIQSTIT
ncbi:hypothetical protein BVRB_6g150790 [Beta vulgaris subsp. vulgaris]|nr:hypothetical protein BVRB_6g150790 [Beta vulgaris subsp. vulgaris]